MKNSFLKKGLSCLLSMILVVSACPLVSLAAENSSTEWTQIASTDFSQAVWSGGGNGATSDNTYSVTDAPTLAAGDKSMSWSIGTYQSEISTGEKGVYIDDGYMYLSGYSGSAEAVTPLTGLDTFKLDLAFSYNQDFTDVSASSTDYCFLKLGTGTAYSKQSDSMSSNNVFSQSTNGTTYVGSATSDPFTKNEILANQCITTSSAHISSGVEYHYILQYSRGYLRGYITDSEYNTVQSVFGGKTALDTSAITTLCFGDDNNSYYTKYMNYHSVTFYSGKDTVNITTKDTARNKFLFAYFTGQKSDDPNKTEEIRFAVSDDGYNWEALNGNKPILNNTPSTCYPAGGESISYAPSGAARDPYILQARNKDGSIAKGYYVLATDLKVTEDSSYRNSKLLVWYLEDITDADSVQPWNVETSCWFGAETLDDFQAWAPEAIWDDQMNMYMIYWSTGEDVGYDNIKVHYAYTNDFKTFYNKEGLELGTTDSTGTLVRPDVLFETYYKYSGGTLGLQTLYDYKAIDADITYDGNLYYMYFKKEKEQQIYYCTSEHASGPYSTPFKFSDSDYTEKLEGCEVFQLNDSSYILMMDRYDNDSGVFLSYSGTSLDSFNPRELSNVNMNHLSPRHGAVTYITTQEYNDLIAKFGKSTYDSSGLTDGTAVNDTLVARYFTNSDSLYDATGHGYTLTSGGVGITPEVYDGKVSAKFVSNSATSSSSPDNGGYAYLNSSQLNDISKTYNINEKDGITLDWYGYTSSSNNGRFFDISTSSIGGISYSDSATDYGFDYAYYAANDRFGVGSANDVADGYDSAYTGAWHHYTVTITNGYMNVYVDGSLSRTTYSKGTKDKQGCPLYSSTLDSSWFTNVFGTGYLRFGVSSFTNDILLDGNISDFRIYSRALSQDDITASIDQLTVSDSGAAVNLDNRVFYDPMENVDADNDGTYEKTAYTATVEDPQTIHKSVLDLTGGVETHNPTGGYTAVSSDTGYTVSMFYNPGASVGGDEAIFNIGKQNETNNLQYFELHENGYLFYNWNNGSDSFIDISNAFGDQSLKANEWYHIVIQIIPNASYDIIKIYLNGTLVQSIDTYNNSYNKNLQPDRSVHAYFANNHNVTYGLNCGYWSPAANGYIDDFAIYSGLYSANDIYAQDNLEIADALIQTAVSAYTAKMDGTVYTNMSDAYNAYDAIIRYKYAMDYGQVEFNSAKIVELYQNFNTELNDLQEYTGPATKQGLSSSETNIGTSTAVPAKYTQNMLTSVDLGNHNEYIGGTNSNGVCGAILSSSFVWLYDGNGVNGVGTQMTAPVGGGAHHTSGGTKRLRSIYINSGDIQFGGAGYGGTGDDDCYWRISTTETTKDWVYENTSGVSLMGYNDTDQDHAYTPSSTAWFYGSNYLTYTGDASQFNNTSLFYTTTTPQYYGHDNKSSKNEINFSSPIYIVNYIPVRTALNNESLTAILANVTNYNPSDVQELLQAYDALTSLSYMNNPNTGEPLTAVESDVKALTDKIQELIANLNNVSTDIQIKADDSALSAAYNSETDFYTASKGNEVIYDETAQTYTETGSIYTTSSWKAYENAYNSIKNYYASLDPYTAVTPDSPNQPFATDPNDITNLEKHLSDAKDLLVVVADYTKVDEAVPRAQADDGKKIANYDTADAQIYTYDSYIAFSDAYDGADYWKSKDATYRADTEKYKTTYVQNAAEGPYIAYDVNDNLVTDPAQTPYYYTFIGDFYENPDDASPSRFGSGDYIKVGTEYIKLNGHRYYVSAIAKPADATDQAQYDAASDRQKAIIDTAADLVKKQSELKNIDEPAAYETYDYVQAVVNGLDRNKYTAEALAGLDTKIAECRGKVYVNLSGDTLAKYNSVTGKSFTESSNICNSGFQETDPISAQLLSYINDTLNVDANYRHFNAKFTVQKGDSETTPLHTEEKNNVVYGGTFEFSLPEEYKGNAVQWTVTTYEDDGTTLISSSKFGYGSTVSRVADSNVVFCAVIDENGTASESTPYKVEIYNIYNRLVKIVYTTDKPALSDDAKVLTVNDSAESYDEVPFYTFANWSVTEPDSNNVIKARMNYTVNDSYTINVVNGKLSGRGVSTADSSTVSAEYDTKLTVTYTAPENAEGTFHAWAIDNGDGTYQIASYSETYQFYAFANENFVPVMAVTQTVDGVSTTDYKVNGKTITAAMIDGSTSFNVSDGNVSSGVTADDFVQAKLAAKAPFIAIARTEKSGTMNRAYSRITEGGSGFDSCYVTFINTANNAEVTYSVSNVLTTGQFIVSVNTSATIQVRTEIVYGFDYVFTGSNTSQSSTTSINTRDYSSVKSF